MLRLGTLPPDKARPALEAVERNASALKKIIQDVLDVSRIVAGRLRLNVQPVDLAAILHEVLVKPIDPLELLVAVATLLPRRSGAYRRRQGRRDRGQRTRDKGQGRREKGEFTGLRHKTEFLPCPFSLLP
jgi:hypothetical protein